MPVVVGTFSSSIVGWAAIVEELNQQQSTATTLSCVTTFRYALTASAGIPRESAATISILRPPSRPPAAGVGEHDASRLQAVATLGDPQRRLRALFHEQDRDPLGVECLHDLDHALDIQRRQAERRLVEHEEPGPRHQRAPDG